MAFIAPALRKPNLLLCFDAFGTLFSPKAPVAKQYADMARRCGLAGFNDDEVESRLRAAIKEETRLNPNFGKATGLGASKWWTNVIHKTFTPWVRDGQAIPPSLAPALLHRFSSSDGYESEPDLVSSLRSLRRPSPARIYDRIVVGVITNSDDRVPAILSSLGLDVSPLRYGSEPFRETGKSYDIDFHCMSYDVGVEKPHRRMFEAACEMLARSIAVRGETAPSIAELDSWQKIYIGDEYAKDVVGASRAGWHSVLLDVNEGGSGTLGLDACLRQLPADVADHNAVRVRSIRALVAWLTGNMPS